MCGLVAVWSPAGGAASAGERIGAALHALRHRGPDGAGRWGSTDGRIALGHTRLAVIDLAGGAQPVASEDGAIVAVVNGELYDHLALGNDLRARGHRLRSNGDAELLVHLYEERGDACVEALGGELAFVLWDGRRRRLLAGRDRFGIKPLLWARLPSGGIALASEAKALFALGVAARWDDESFFHAAHTQYPWPDRTLFAGVHQIEPGCLLIVDDDGASNGGTLTHRRYHDLAFTSDEDDHLTLDTAAAAIRTALDRAVQQRTVADTPIAVQLSGGLDSTTVAALAIRHRADLRAFTVGFDAPAYDERDLAAATAAALNLPLTVVPLTATLIAEHFPAAVAHAESLAINGHLVGKWALSRAIRAAGCKVALTGEGADELFAGYPHLRLDAGAGAAITGHTASRGLMLPEGDGLPLDGVRALLRGHVPTWLAAKATLGRRVRSLLAPDLLARFATVDPYAALIERTAAPPTAPPLHQSAHTWIRSALAQYILRTLGDGMELAHGVEGRVPFLDPAVATLAMRLPPALLVAGDLDKPVLRRAVADLLPPAIARRPKHPFLAPPLVRIAPTLVQDLLRDHARRSSLVDRPRLLAVLDSLPSLPAAEQQAWDPALMLILSSAILQTRYAA